MAVNIGDIYVKFSADMAAFRTDMQNVAREVGTSVSGISGQLSSLGGSFTQFAHQTNESITSVTEHFEGMKKMLEVVGVAMSVEAIKGWVEETVNSVAELGRQATQLGMNAEAFQALQQAAEDTGVEQEAFVSGMQRFITTMGKAVDGSKQQAQLFKSLGISLVDAQGNVRDTTSVLLDFADKLAEVPNIAERARLEVAAFGKGGQALDPLLSQGSEAIRKLAEEAQRAGVIIGTDTIKAMNDLKKEMHDTEDKWKKFSADLVADLKPAIDFIIADLERTMREMEAFGVEAATLIERAAGLTPPIAGVGAGKEVGEIQVQLEQVGKAIAETREALRIVKDMAAAANAIEDTGKFAKDVAEKEALLNNQLRLQTELVKKLADARKQAAQEHKDQTGPANPLEAPPPPGSTGGAGDNLGVGGAGPKGKSQAEQDAEAYARVKASLEAELATLQGDSDALKLNTSLREAHAAAGSHEADVITALVTKIQAQKDANAAAKKTEKEYQDDLKEVGRVMTELTPKTDKLFGYQKLLNQAYMTGLIGTEEYTLAQARLAKALHDADPAVKKAVEDARQFNDQLNQMADDGVTNLGSSLADLALGAKTWQEAMSDALRLVFNDLMQILSLELKGGTGGSGLGGILGSVWTAVFGSLLGAGSAGVTTGDVMDITPADMTFAGGMAGGGRLAFGDFAIVGEKGPELWAPDRPGTVLPNDALRRGGAGVVYNIDARGADVAAVERMRTMLAELHRSIEPRAIAAVNAARKRGGTFSVAFTR